jgi:predicted DNA-binding transcriptional regulator AlpA
MTESIKFLRLKDVQDITGLCRSAIYGLPNFPKPVKLGTSRAVAWIEREVASWMQEQVRARG